jgi:hypothetical protein
MGPEPAPPTPWPSVSEQLAADDDDAVIGLAQRSEVEPEAVERPGPRFSITTSLTAMSCRINAASSGDRRSMPRLRLLR